MPRRLWISIVALLLVTPLQAAELRIEAPWIRQPPPGAMATGGFMVLKNPGKAAIEVVAARSDAAEWVELHRSIEERGVARMVEQKRLVIPAGGELRLEPGGYHLMMMRPSRLVAGDRAHITLRYADGAEQTVHAPVRRKIGSGHRRSSSGR